VDLRGGLDGVALPVTPFYSFILPAFNEAEELPKTLQALRRAADGLSYEVIVCDNASTDDTARIAREREAKVVYEPIRQISRSRNAAAREAGGKWFIFLDADTRINRFLMQALDQRLRSGHYGAAGSLVKFDLPELDLFPSLVLGTWNLISRVTGWAAGSFLVCHRQAFAETGGFSTRYFAGEEIDFSIKVHRWCRQQNLKIYIETANPVISSGRKIEGKSTWTLFRQLSVLLPGALTSRKACAFWYDPAWRENKPLMNANKH
jgi:glycosyltransferase involved in cell wall biosynthesis